jgi:hypothetical protein
MQRYGIKIKKIRMEDKSKAKRNEDRAKQEDMNE